MSSALVRAQRRGREEVKRAKGPGAGPKIRVVDALPTKAEPKAPPPPVEYQNVHGLGEGFRTLVEERQDANAEIAALKGIIEKLSTKLFVMLTKAGVVSTVIRYDKAGPDDPLGWTATIAKGREPSRKIVEGLLSKRLLREGMAADTIAKVIADSTEQGKPGEPHLVVTALSNNAT